MRAEVSRIIRGSIVSGHFAEASSADWSAKEGRGNVLTGDSCLRCTKLLKRLAIGQDSNVTCGTFAEASSAEWSKKKGARIFVTGYFAVVKAAQSNFFQLRAVDKHADVA